MTKPMLASMAVALVLAANQAAHAETVRSFEPGPTPGTEFTPGVWYAVDVRTGGTAGIVDLTGMGGALENSQPLPTGAATLTTDFTDAAKAEVGVFSDYGNFMQALASLTLTYSYFKKTNTGQTYSRHLLSILSSGLPAARTRTVKATVTARLFTSHIGMARLLGPYPI